MLWRVGLFYAGFVHYQGSDNDGIEEGVINLKNTFDTPHIDISLHNGLS